MLRGREVPVRRFGIVGSSRVYERATTKWCEIEGFALVTFSSGSIGMCGWTGLLLSPDHFHEGNGIDDRCASSSSSAQNSTIVSVERGCQFVESQN
jgi:hypothetical protein